MDGRAHTVPARFGYMNLAGGLNELALRFDYVSESPTTIDLSRIDFCDPAATVTLAAYAANTTRLSGEPINLQGWDPGSYLSRVGFKTFAGHRDDFPRKRLSSDRLTSLIEVRTADERQRARAEVLDVLDVQHDGANGLLDYCLEEMLRNVDDHAQSPVNALVQAQYYEARHEVVMAVADTGVGVMKSLSVRHEVADHEAALKAALLPGVSGRNTRKGTNAGLGLPVSSALITEVGGIFQVVSGDCVMEVRRGGTSILRLRGTQWPGVIVVMVVPRDDSLNWERTFTKVMDAL